MVRKTLSSGGDALPREFSKLGQGRFFLQSFQFIVQYHLFIRLCVG